MLNIVDGKVKFLDQEFDWDDLKMRLDARMAGQLDSIEGDIELFGKKIKVKQISRMTMEKIVKLYAKAEKDVEGNLIEDKYNRMIDVKAASLILLDGMLGLKQWAWHWAHWRILARRKDYNTYILQAIIKRVLNDVEPLFFWSSVDSIRSTALQRMKIKVAQK